MKFARIVFSVAAIYGFISLLPLYFLIDRIGRDAPPALTHVEFFYGFVGLAILWQIVFLLIAAKPAHYRPLMAVAILEKLVYSVPVVILFSMGQASPKILGPALVDPIFCVLFIAAYFQTRTVAGVAVAQTS